MTVNLEFLNQRDMVVLEQIDADTTVIPLVGDVVWVQGQKKLDKWEVRKRAFYFNDDGTLMKVSFLCEEASTSW